MTPTDRPHPAPRSSPAASRPSPQPWVERRRAPTTRRVGLLYIATALSFLALAAVEFALLRLQLIVPENSLIEPEIFNRLLSTAPGDLVVLAAIPLALGLVGYIVPLQIGARGVAFPRLHQLSYWLYLVGGVTIYASFLYTAPESGTIALPPLSTPSSAPPTARTRGSRGPPWRRLGFICFAVNLVVTVNRLRAPGIAWRRMPLFAWAATVIGWLLLVDRPGDDRRADDARDRPRASTASSSIPARAARRCSTSTSPTSSSPAPT